jgi:hypothetical protein
MHYTASMVRNADILAQGDFVARALHLLGVYGGAVRRLLRKSYFRRPWESKVERLITAACRPAHSSTSKLSSVGNIAPLRQTSAPRAPPVL